MIYTDTVGDLGFAEELGNYAEYSGAPSTAETYTFAKTLLRWCPLPPAEPSSKNDGCLCCHEVESLLSQHSDPDGNASIGA